MREHVVFKLVETAEPVVFAVPCMDEGAMNAAAAVQSSAYALAGALTSSGFRILSVHKKAARRSEESAALRLSVDGASRHRERQGSTVLFRELSGEERGG